MSSLVLVSHKLCPYVQRAAIMLEEKGIAYERRDVDLTNKPDWFLAISPLGKTPVLLVDDQPVFESSVICEYLDETYGPAMHPSAPLQRARHRSWIEFGSALLSLIGAFYSAPTSELLTSKATELRTRFSQLESVLGNGHFFDGDEFSIVDATFAPVFRYFDTIESIIDFDFFALSPKVSAWRATLRQRPSVRNVVDPNYAHLLESFFLSKGSALSQRMSSAA